MCKEYCKLSGKLSELNNQLSNKPLSLKQLKLEYKKNHKPGCLNRPLSSRQTKKQKDFKTTLRGLFYVKKKEQKIQQRIETASSTTCLTSI